jgi:hypothetical protein
MASIVSFYNVYDSIKVKITGAGPEAGTTTFFNKKTTSFTTQNVDHFIIKSDENSLLIRYIEVSAVAPPGHATIDQLITILESWISGSDPTSSAEKDFYQRTRVVAPYTVFDSTFRTSLETRKYNTILGLGTETWTHDSDEQMGILTLPVTTLAHGVVQTKRYMMYQPGKQMTVQVSALLRTVLAVTNNAVRLGYFDDSVDKAALTDLGGSGVFIEMDAAGALFIVTRNFTGGVQTDNSVAQALWNIDPLDGTGTSGVTLDPIKINTYVFEVSTDGGGGVVRCGILYDNHVYYFHVFNSANSEVNSFLHTCSLPVRLQSDNTGIADSGAISKLYCTSVTIDGGIEPRGFTNSIDEGNAAIPPHVMKSVGDVKPLISIRLKQARCRSTLWPQFIQMINARAGNFFHFRLVLNGTLTGPSWTSAGSDSAVEYDKTATVIAGGTDLLKGYWSGNVQAGNDRLQLRDLFADVQLHASIQGSTLDTITLVGEYVSSQCDIYTAASWIEYY